MISHVGLNHADHVPAIARVVIGGTVTTRSMAVTTSPNHSKLIGITGSVVFVAVNQLLIGCNCWHSVGLTNEFAIGFSSCLIVNTGQER